MFIEKPWGTIEILLNDLYYKVIRIIVYPNQRFSLQYHKLREEHWTIIGGSGEMVIGDNTMPVETGFYLFVPKETIHRATAGEEGLVFIETQVGVCFEDDIHRIEDDYGRINMG